MPILGLRKKPRIGFGPMQKRRPAGRQQWPALAKPVPVSMRPGFRAKQLLPSEQRAAMQRKSWMAIPVLGPLVELLARFFYPRREIHQRRALREGPLSLMAKLRGRQVTAAKRRKFLKTMGVPQGAERQQGRKAA
jgi:hypothetical protein